MRFMKQLLDGIESMNITAHSPIEQRWSASSSSIMSPAYGPSNGLHSWVGIINYLPPASTPEIEQQQRNDITNMFRGPYYDLMQSVCMDYDAVSHWAKLEAPKSFWDFVAIRTVLSKRYPLEKFNFWRAQLDPKNILANPLINCCLGEPNIDEFEQKYQKEAAEAKIMLQKLKSEQINF